MEKEVSLKDLTPNLCKYHIKLNLVFLNKLLQSASGSEKPHRVQEFAKKIGCPINRVKKSSTTIYGWTKGYRTIPLSKLDMTVSLSNYSWEDVEKNLVSMKAGPRNGEVSPKFPIILNEKLGQIIGHILGDGSIDMRFKTVFFSNSNPELIKEFIAI